MQPADSRDLLESSTPTLTEREVAREVVRYLKTTFKGKLNVEYEAFRPYIHSERTRNQRVDIAIYFEGEKGIL